MLLKPSSVDMIRNFMICRYQSVDAGLIWYLSLMMNGIFHKTFPNYLHGWLTLMGITMVPTSWIKMAGCLLVLVGGIGGCVRYIKNPNLRKWNH